MFQGNKPEDFNSFTRISNYLYVEKFCLRQLFHCMIMDALWEMLKCPIKGFKPASYVHFIYKKAEMPHFIRKQLSRFASFSPYLSVCFHALFTFPSSPQLMSPCITPTLPCYSNQLFLIACFSDSSPCLTLLDFFTASSDHSNDPALLLL